jgi:GAF domain-containing protein
MSSVGVLMNSDTKLVSAATDAVRGAASLDEALAALVQVLRPRFDLWYGAICSHPTDAPHITILAKWSLAESVFDAGTAVATNISGIIVGVLAELHAGNPARFVIGGDPDSLVEHLLASQGVASVVTVPIHRDDEGLLLLALGTSTQDAFLDAGRGFYLELARGISDTMLRLVTTKTEH